MKPQQGVTEHLDWSFEWKKLLDTGETLVSAVWTSPGLSWDTDSITGTISTCFFSGGEIGKSYLVTCTMTTNQSRTFVRRFKLQIIA